MEKQTNSPTGGPKNSIPNKAQSAESSLHSLSSEIEALGDRDFFQELMHKGAEVLEKNGKAVALVGLAAALAALSWVGYGWFQEKTEKNAQEAFYALEKQVSDKREAFEKAKSDALLPSPDKKNKTASNDPKAIAATGDIEKDFGPLVSNLEAFADSHRRTSAGAQAAILAADLRMEYKQADRALGVLKGAREATSPKTLVGGLVRMAEANALAASEKCGDALGLWQTVLDEKFATFLHGEAALRAGLCLETMGQKDRAIEMYRKAAAAGERSSAAQSAKSLLRRLELGS